MSEQSDTEVAQVAEEIDGMESYGVTLLVRSHDQDKIECSIVGQGKSYTNSSVTFFRREDGWNTPYTDDYHVAKKAMKRLNQEVGALA